MDFSFNLNIAEPGTEHKAVPMDENTVYDIIIVGGGPAAMTAAVYCMRKGLNTGLIAKSIGGQVAETQGIENYMGYVYVEGMELVNKFQSQVKQFEIGFKEGQLVTGLESGKIKHVLTGDGKKYKTKSVILTQGNSWRKLGVPGESEYTGKGVAYCATCDAPFYKDKNVIVVGGGNSGIEAAIDLAKVAKHVTLVEFSDKLKADNILVEKLEEFSNFDILTSHQIKEIKGDQFVTSVTLINRALNKEVEMEIDGVFVEIGLKPNTEFLENVINLNDHKEIIIDDKCETSEPGIYAAGDVTTVPYKQIIIAAGEGAKAALSAYEYVLMYK